MSEVDDNQLKAFLLGIADAFADLPEVRSQLLAADINQVSYDDDGAGGFIDVNVRPAGKIALDLSALDAEAEGDDGLPVHIIVHLSKDGIVEQIEWFAWSGSKLKTFPPRNISRA